MKKYEEQLINILTSNLGSTLFDDYEENEPIGLIEEIKQFIKDLRKKDRDELIKMLPKKSLGHINEEGFCDTCGYKICRCRQTNDLIDTFRQLIKDYYN